MTQPAPNDYPPSFAGYISLVPEEDVLSAIEQQSSETQKLISALDDTRALNRYAEGKWSIKEVIGHVTDTERVMAYRALAIARGDKQSLPGFDENLYIAHANFDAWKIGDLGEAFALTRRSTIVLLRNLPEEAWNYRGLANGKEITVNALAHMIVGHERHHLKILHERYGV